MGENSFYVGEKWLNGTLTNRLHLFGPSIVHKTRVLPDLMVFLNPLANMAAIRECAIEHIPTVGIVDSNADPRIVMYAIPANDESQRTAELISGVLSIAGREGVELWKAEQRVRDLSKPKKALKQRRDEEYEF
jgi:small subunit ribosomal protein S2